MRRSVLLATALLTVVVAPAQADDTGGAEAPPAASRAVVAPQVAELAVRGGPSAAPGITVRFAGQGTAVVADALLLRVGDRSVIARLPLGRVAMGRRIEVSWHRLRHLAPGRYLVRIDARDAWGRQLRRTTELPGSRPLLVGGRATSSPSTSAVSGTFPVAGSYSFGEPFGAPRKGYTHQGQDMAAADGTPVVAPRAGTISAIGYQASAAGEYVVMASETGESYFFAHCRRNSTAVSPGEAVAAGDRVCRVGSTGRASGPHLHFEIWLGGWRTGPDSRPIDPRLQLDAWAG